MKTVRLGEVAVFTNGYGFGPEEWHDQGLRIVRIQNLTDPTKEYLRTMTPVPDKFRVRPGELLVSWSATLGVFEWTLNEDAYVNQHIFRVVPNAKLVDKRYLMYALSISIDSMARFTHGSTMKHINRAEFLDTVIPLPSLPEQRRIAAVLDRVDDLRRKRREATRKLEELQRSVFMEMFGDPVSNPKGWPMKTLSLLYSSAGGGAKCGPFGSALKRADYTEAGIPVWTMDNIAGTRFDASGCLFVPTELWPKLNQYATELGDVIISRAGTVGKMCVIEYSGRALISTNLIRLRFDQASINPYYFVALMDYGRGNVGRLRTGADGAYSFMNTGVLKNFSIPVPPLALQDHFRSVTQAIRRRELDGCKNDMAMAQFAASLQSLAFSGRLFSPSPVLEPA